jgi:hypothetical protein
LHDGPITELGRFSNEIPLALVFFFAFFFAFAFDVIVIIA